MENTIKEAESFLEWASHSLTNEDGDNPTQAEIERLKNLIRSYDNGKEHYAKRCESLLAELTAANQQIAGLVQTIESHREQRELDRICYENRLAEANQRIAELEEQNKKYWFMIEHGLGVEDITPPSYPHP